MRSLLQKFEEAAFINLKHHGSREGHGDHLKEIDWSATLMLYFVEKGS